MKAPAPFNKGYFDNKTGDALRKTISPNWESTERHLQIVNAPAEASTILEIGCGIGRILRELYDQVPGRHCVGYDASEAMIREGKEYVGDRNIELLKCAGEGEDLAYQSDYFDFAFSIVVFQHIPSTPTVHRYITEMARMLKPGGRIRFQVLSEDFNKGHLWSYHPLEDLQSLLVSLGLDEVEQTPMSRWTVFSARKPA